LIFMADGTFVNGRITRFSGDRLLADEDRLAVEEPLQIRLGRASLAITMRTPGHDSELAAGFLLTEGIIRKREDVDKIALPTRRLPNIITVTLRRGAKINENRLRRYFPASSSCGLCGRTTLQAISAKVKAVATDLNIPLSLLLSLPVKLRNEQQTFDETGGLHGAGIFDRWGEPLFVREDVGRHNAVDKVIGAALLERKFPLDSHILTVSGRASFEIMQKALIARIPVVTAVSAPSSLAVALARKFKMTLVGFLRDGRCNVYAGEERLRL
jgi:FdhD protein